MMAIFPVVAAILIAWNRISFDCNCADVNLENSSYFISLCVCVCVCVCVRACVRACACVHVCMSTVRSYQQEDIRLSSLV
jgi:hypothetical protein